MRITVKYLSQISWNSAILAAAGGGGVVFIKPLFHKSLFELELANSVVVVFKWPNTAAKSEESCGKDA